jgi:hypothetical protein
MLSAADFDLSGLPEGSVHRWQTNNGNTKIVFKGKRGGAYRLEFSRDGSKGDPAKGTLWATRRGEIVQAKFGSSVTKFTPHDCSLTLGKCVYTEVNDKLGQRTMIWRAKVRGNKWVYTLHHTKAVPGNLVETGSFTVDASGFYVDRDYVIYANGKPQTKAYSRRIRASN